MTISTLLRYFINRNYKEAYPIEKKELALKSLSRLRYLAGCVARKYVKDHPELGLYINANKSSIPE